MTSPSSRASSTPCDELRDDTRKQLERMKRIQQASQARDRAVEALVDSIDIPLPEKFVEHELEHRREAFGNQLEQAQPVDGRLP